MLEQFVLEALCTMEVTHSGAVHHVDVWICNELTAALVCHPPQVLLLEDVEKPEVDSGKKGGVEDRYSKICVPSGLSATLVYAQGQATTASKY